ncbi:hypothetical protein A2U01_0093024, partial [Trifolium medium]|nr:hypothetical protein [Trifolium medium]
MYNNVVESDCATLMRMLKGDDFEIPRTYVGNNKTENDGDDVERSDERNKDF